MHTSTPQPNTLMQRLRCGGNWLVRWFVVSTHKWQQDHCLRYGASLSYYMVLGMAPLMFLLLRLMGMVLDKKIAQQQILHQVQELAGAQAARTAHTVLELIAQPTGTAAAIFAIILLAVGASAVVMEFSQALDHIWRNVTHANSVSIWRKSAHFFWRRLLMLLVLLATLSLLIISLSVSAYLIHAARWLSGVTGGVVPFSSMLHSGTVLGMLVALLLTLFFIMPSRRPPWRRVWVAAILAALLLILGKRLIALYISWIPLASLHGAAGSLVAIMVWVYCSSQLLLFAAELAWVWDVTPSGQLPQEPEPFEQFMQHAQYLKTRDEE